MNSERVDLSGQFALVTGGGHGIGRAIALALAQAGAAAVVLARSPDQLAEVVADVARANGRALACPADVTRRADVEAAVARVEGELGPIDLLVNNAGVGGLIGPLAASDPVEWWRCVEVNLRGPLLCSRAVLPGMLARRRGRIINVASGAGTRAIPNLSAYVTSKAALIHLTENLAVEVADARVRVFAIQPGTVRTALAESVLNSEEARQWVPWFAEMFERGQDVPPEQAGQPVVLLASGRADALTGRFVAVEWDADRLIDHTGVGSVSDLVAFAPVPATCFLRIGQAMGPERRDQGVPHCLAQKAGGRGLDAGANPTPGQERPPRPRRLLRQFVAGIIGPWPKRRVPPDTPPGWVVEETCATHQAGRQYQVESATRYER
jgi:NAD(P)-dependent dehydrogenase (short-subunit alcohol dehydrogenase family)